MCIQFHHYYFLDENTFIRDGIHELALRKSLLLVYKLLFHSENNNASL